MPNKTHLGAKFWPDPELLHAHISVSRSALHQTVSLCASSCPCLGPRENVNLKPCQKCIT